MKAGDRRRVSQTIYSSAAPQQVAFDIGDVITVVSIDRDREECHATDARHGHHLFSIEAMEQLTVALPGPGVLQ